jgi:hypothetical protein
VREDGHRISSEVSSLPPSWVSTSNSPLSAATNSTVPVVPSDLRLDVEAVHVQLVGDVAVDDQANRDAEPDGNRPATG